MNSQPHSASEPSQAQPELNRQEEAKDASFAGEAEARRQAPEDAGASEETPEDAARALGAQDTPTEQGAESLEAESPAAEQELAEGPVEEEEGEEAESKDWYILKVQVNREESIRDALTRRVRIAGLDSSFGEIIVPTEDVAEFNKSGKRRIVKKKLYPGYIMVNLAINDDTWFLVRETPGIGDFTGSAGKPTPMASHEVVRILNASKDIEAGEAPIKTAIPFKAGDRVRVKEGYFQNFEGDIESVDEANGRVTVMINIFGRSTPVELEHWQIESV